MPKFCVVAGNYGNNVLFKGRLKTLNTTNSYGMDIYYSTHVSEAVVRGACLARVEGEFSQSSGSRYSVTILIYKPYNSVVKEYPAAASRTFEGSSKPFSPVLEWKIKKGDTVEANHSIDADSGGKRERFFSCDEEIVFTDTIYTSDDHPGKDKHTFLKYKTSNPVDWRRNELDLLGRGIEVKAFEVTWELRNVPFMRDDGSWGSMPREALHANHAKKMQSISYKYHIGVGQIDIKLSIETFFTQNRRHMMAMSHKQIVVMDEPESTMLAQEYNNLPDPIEDFENRDEPSSAGGVPGQGVSGLAEDQKETAAADKEKLREYYDAQWSGTADSSAKRLKRTGCTPPAGTALLTPSIHRLQRGISTAINDYESSPCPSISGTPRVRINVVHKVLPVLENF